MKPVYCRSCGQPCAPEASTCSACQSAAAQATAQASVAASEDPTWSWRFTLIDKAGGSALPKLWSMTPKEIWTIRFNVLALLFGPIYYAVKGMWKKGLTLFGLCIVIVGCAGFALEALGVSPDFLVWVTPGVMCGQANVSYYNLVRHGRNGWW